MYQMGNCSSENDKPLIGEEDGEELEGSSDGEEEEEEEPPNEKKEDLLKKL